MATPRLARLPRWISHWLGYRPEPVKPLSTYQVALWSFITSFCGLSVVQAIFNYSDYFTERNVPGIVASYVSPTPHQMNLPEISTLTHKKKKGCISSPGLRRNRKPTRTTARSNLRPLLQRLNRHLHHEIV
jgi:hypothetical protein